jgi:hypothetical protein
LPLEGQRRKPSDYEVTTSALLYYPPRGFEVETPVWQHYLKHQRGSALRGKDWEAFEDPAHTTYGSYVAARRDQEAFLDRLYARPAPKLAAGLRPWLAPLSALRFFLHGLQMTAAYVGALAPSGRISVVAVFQAADELRRIQRLCQWLSRSGSSVVELDALGRELWQEHAAFQPLRRLTEELLVTYDWAEALIGLNGVVRPARAVGGDARRRDPGANLEVHGRRRALARGLVHPMVAACALERPAQRSGLHQHGNQARRTGYRSRPHATGRARALVGCSSSPQPGR